MHFDHKSYGARIRQLRIRKGFTQEQLAEKLNVSAQMADRGIMNRDEIREIWNLPPLPNGEGEAYTIRGEYYFVGKEKKGENEGNADQDGATVQDSSDANDDTTGQQTV